MNHYRPIPKPSPTVCPPSGRYAPRFESHRAIVTDWGRVSQVSVVYILLGNLKNAASGAYYAFNFAKHTPRFLTDFQYRSNRRYDLHSMLPRLVRAAATTRPRTQQQPTAAELCK